MTNREKAKKFGHFKVLSENGYLGIERGEVYKIIPDNDCIRFLNKNDSIKSFGYSSFVADKGIIFITEKKFDELRRTEK